MSSSIETERETDGRFIAEVIEMPGVMVYGTTGTGVQQLSALLTYRTAAALLGQMLDRTSESYGVLT